MLSPTMTNITSKSEFIKEKINEGVAVVSDEYVEHKYKETPFSVRMSHITFKTGGWNYSAYAIYKEINKTNIHIGTLCRNYGYSAGVFAPYFSNNNWYFLFCESYDCISIFDEKLNKLGEGKKGLCPYEIYLPRFKFCKETEYIQFTYTADNVNYYDELDEESFSINFGFVHGCYWGDSSTNIKVIDLSEINNHKIIL